MSHDWRKNPKSKDWVCSKCKYLIDNLVKPEPISRFVGLDDFGNEVYMTCDEMVAYDVINS